MAQRQILKPWVIFAYLLVLFSHNGKKRGWPVSWSCTNRFLFLGWTFQMLLVSSRLRFPALCVSLEAALPHCPIWGPVVCCIRSLNVLKKRDSKRWKTVLLSERKWASHLCKSTREISNWSWVALEKKRNMDALWQEQCMRNSWVVWITGRHVSVALWFCLDQDSVGFRSQFQYFH